jgi:triacylglycerol esterase/lipase EstA (alpha/beta hydrolase family)
MKVRFGVLALVATLVVGGLTGCEPPRTTDKTKAILFVHGYNPTSTSVSCSGTFDGMIAKLRAQGFTGPMVKVGFYSGDTGCDVNLHSFASYDDRDSWKPIAKAFSALVQRNYTSKGISVDAVGYSMGALVIRGAVHGAQMGESGFGAPIDVQDVVSLGGPHDGAAWYSNLCFWGQCGSMRPGNGDLDWLNRNGNPQGSKGTDFTVIGSQGDAVVPDESATHMALPASNKVVYADVPHTGSSNYMGDPVVVSRAGAALADPGK